MLLLFQLNLSEAGDPPVEPPVEPPAPTETGAPGGGSIIATSGRHKAGSGRWVRVDSDTVWLDATDAKGRGRTSTVEWQPEARRACATGCTSTVELVAWASLEPAAACGRSTTTPVRLIRDDTAEMMRLMALLPTAKRVQTTLPEDVQHVLDLIQRMKKKAA